MTDIFTSKFYFSEIFLFLSAIITITETSVAAAIIETYITAFRITALCYARCRTHSCRLLCRWLIWIRCIRSTYIKMCIKNIFLLPSFQLQACQSFYSYFVGSSFWTISCHFSALTSNPRFLDSHF